MPDYSDFVTILKKLHLKRKGNRPKVAPQKFYPSQVELQTQELIREELGEYGYRLADAAQKGGVQGVYDVPGAVPQGFDEKVRTVAEAVSLFQVRAFANFSELAVGERYFPGGNEQRDIILNTWSDNFVNLCKSTNEEMRKKVAGVVSDGVLGGRDIRDLTKDIQNTCSEFTRNKAELIATTEVGKLNTAIARNQSESAGIEFYEWSAAMDGRTRESHAVMDGKICKWGDDEHYYEWVTEDNGKRKLAQRDRKKIGGYIGAPGTDFRCRCIALPYVPEYEDDYEAEREKSIQRGVVQTQERPEPMSAEQIAFINQIKESRLIMGKSRKPGNREANLLRKREQADYELEMARDYTYLEKQPIDKELNTLYKLWCRKDGSDNLNKYLLDKNLRNKREPHPRFDDREKRMNEYIEANPLKRNMTIWRSMSLPTLVLKKARKDKRLFFPGIVSFSKSMQHSASYYDPNAKEKDVVPFLIKMNAKKGDRIAPPYQIKNGKMVGYPEECEFNAPSKTNIRIIKERTLGEVLILECEMES